MPALGPPPLLDLDPFPLAVVVVVSWLAGLAKVAFGIGAGVFLTPVLALVLPPKVAVGLMGPLMVITDVEALRRHWRQWHTGHMLVLLPTCLVGVALGTAFLAWAPSGMVRKTIGVIALTYVAIQLLQRLRGSVKSPAPMPAWGGWILGFVAGGCTAIAHAGGIIMSIYLLTAGLAKNTFIATVVGLFFLTNLLKLPLYWETGILTTPILLTGVALTPVMLAGGYVGIRVNRFLTVEQFTRLVMVIVALAGTVLLAT